MKDLSKYNLNKKQLQIALKELKTLKIKIKEGDKLAKETGICNNPYGIIDHHVRRLLKDDKILSNWKYYSGDDIFPIKSTIKGMSSASSYCIHSSKGTLWEGRQYWFRIRLLNYWIKILEESINTI